MESKNFNKYIVLSIIVMILLLSLTALIVLDNDKQPLEVIDQSSNIVTEMIGPINTNADTTTTDTTTTTTTTTTTEETTTTSETTTTTTTVDTTNTTTTTTTTFTSST